MQAGTLATTVGQQERTLLVRLGAQLWYFVVLKALALKHHSKALAHFVEFSYSE
jgi:hypothetical protein